MFDSLWLHEMQHTRSLCPSPSPRVCPLLYCLCLKMSDLISLFIVITSDWPSWYHFKAVCTNVKGLETVISISLCIFCQLCLMNSEIIHTQQKPVQWIVLMWITVPIFNKKCSVSLISLARHHELGAGIVLYQSRERNIGMLRKMSRKLNTNICDTANRPAVLKDRNFYCSVDYSLIFFKKWSIN